MVLPRGVLYKSTSSTLALLQECSGSKWQKYPLPWHGLHGVSELVFSAHVVMFLTRAVVFLQRSAMAESSAAAVAAAGTAAPTVLDELLEITAQSLVRTEVAEHYEVIRELGRGKYGHVMLVTHRQRGKELTAPYELLCLASSPLARVLGGLVGPWGQAPGMVGGSPGGWQDRDLLSQGPSHCTQPEYQARLQ